MKRLILSQYQRVKRLYFQYERWLMPATLVVGFLVDYITFTSIQFSITFTLLFIYWLIAGATIAFVSLYDAGVSFRIIPHGSTALRYARLFAPLALQFTFGALLGSSLIFYWLSGAFSASWPIILIVALLMVFNDIFRHYFLKPVVQLGVYFFITLSLFSLILPFLFKSLEAWLFLLAGGASIGIFCLYVWLLALARGEVRQQKWRIFAAAFGVLAVMNVFYFANIIPPIPLFLREAGLYHDIKKSGNSYIMKAEPETIWQSLVPGQTLNVMPGEKIYFYTAIFAPPELKTTIKHDWQYYDETSKEWVKEGVLSFNIVGGRQEGYKGYSFRSDLALGMWRVYVKNQRGQVLGRMKFEVKAAEHYVPPEEVVR